MGTAGTATIAKALFGCMEDGTEIDLYALGNTRGMIAKVASYGAMLTELHVPDKHHDLADVVLGFDDLAGYLAGHPHFGVTTGRVANRIANATFTLDGTSYQLAQNDGSHHLHGGPKGLDKQVWSAAAATTPDGSTVKFNYRSPDGDQGYPGNLTITVAYTLTHENALRIEYTATTDRPTPVNLTHHSYFHLSGAGNGDILGHELNIAAHRYTPVDVSLIPTGAIESVAGTPFDFRRTHKIGARIQDVGGDPVGYDINYVLDHQDGNLALAATVRDPASGRTMDVYTTEPGMQLYTGNALDGSHRGKRGLVYKQYGGFCLEAQHYPDSINQPHFPTIVLQPGEIYSQTTVYAFRTS